MSGRLIILPKKSWNVWNRDNVEKVMRDERLHKEEQERKAEKQRAVDQERRLEILRKRKRGEEVPAAEAEAEVAGNGKESAEKGEGVVHLGGTGDVQEIALEREEKKGYVEGERHEGHVHLFANVPDQLVRKERSREAEKEKAERELKKKKAEGTAPWSFSEVKPAKAWYEYGSEGAAPVLSSRDGKVMDEQQVARLERRQAARKDILDPISNFLPKAPPLSRGARPPPTGHIAQAQGRGQDGRSSSSIELTIREEPEEERTKKKRSKRETKEKKKKEKKKRERDESEERRTSRKHKKRKKERLEAPSSSTLSTLAELNASIDRIPQSTLPGIVPHVHIPSQPSVVDPREELRRKRVERERQEHRKAVQMLAHRQRSGLSIPGGSTPLINDYEGPQVESDDRAREYNMRFFVNERR